MASGLISQEFFSCRDQAICVTQRGGVTLSPATQYSFCMITISRALAVWQDFRCWSHKPLHSSLSSCMTPLLKDSHGKPQGGSSLIYQQDQQGHHRSFNHPLLQGKVPILNSPGRSSYTELPETQTQPAGSVAKGFLARYPAHCITIICWPACHAPVRMWTLWWKEQRSIHLKPQFSTWCLIQKEFSNYAW